MMEDSWLCIDDDDSSNHSFPDSDVVDSETEAELYSLIHYEENLSSLNSFGIENALAAEVPVLTSNKLNIFCKEESGKNAQNKSVSCLMPVSQKDDKDSPQKEKLLNETIFLNQLAQKLNSVKKKTSDSDHTMSSVLHSDNPEDTSFNQSPKDTSLSDKRKRKTDHYPHKNPSLIKKSSKVLTDSSDSDSVTWTEVDSTNKTFQTNLYKADDIIYLSSDSESHILPSLKKKEAFLKNLSMPNIKIGENPKGKWFINDEDLYRQKKNKLRRYHDNVDDTCTNCNRKGHNSKICPVPKDIKCFICGGGHLGTMCVNRVCIKCYGTGHDSRRCWKPCKLCKLCNMRGHSVENCPDIWRRYHFTTQPGKIICRKQVKQDRYPYCWNCGECGHFGSVCTQPRGLKMYFPTWPCVVSYDDPEDLLRERLKNGYRRRREKFAKFAQLNRRNESYEAGNFMKEKKKKKKKNKLNQQCNNNIKKALREKDFPRTPKNNTLSNLSDDVAPDPFNCLLLLKKQRRNRRKMNRKNRIKQRQQLLKASEQIQLTG